MRRHAVILAAALAWLIGVESAEARLEILVEKATQRMVVIQNGYMRYIWPVSTGRDELATPNGVYTPQRLERTWFSTAYYNSPMPYSIFFHNGYAIHGSYAIDRLGGPASHGCVRLHPHHASLLFDLVQQEGKENTRIEVTDEPRLGGPPPVPPREVDAGRGPRQFDVGRGPGEFGPPEIEPGRGVPGGPRQFDMGRGPGEFGPPGMEPGRGGPGGPGEFDVVRGPRFDMGRGPGEFGPPGTEPGRGPRDVDMGGGPRVIYARRGPAEIDAGRGPPMVEPGRGPRDTDVGGGPRVIYAARGPGEVDAGRGLYPPPPPKIARYRDPPGDVADVIAQRGNRPAATRLALSQKPPPAGRRPLTTVGLGPPPATQPASQSPTPARAPCDAANASESADCRPKAKSLEAKSAEAKSVEAKSAEGPPEQAHPEKQVYGMKVLPASCWSGGASRWRWWGGSSREAACK